MPKTTEKPDKALSRTIPDAYWNGDVRFTVELSKWAVPMSITLSAGDMTVYGGRLRDLHYAACFLPKIASAMSRLDTEACNRELSEREEKRRDRLDRDAQAIAASIGATAVRQHDPRGMPLYLNFPGMVDETKTDWRYQTDRMLAVPVK